MTLKQLEKKANDIRQDIISMLLKAGSGHSAGPLGMADVFTALYFSVLKHNPKKPTWAERDRVILSNGHICPVLYATLAHAGYFPKKELATLRQLNTRLQGHPHRGSLPGIENTSGPLGQGLSQAVGMAIAGRMDPVKSSPPKGPSGALRAGETSNGASKKKHVVYCLMSDGEHDEGQTWEAAMLAGKLKLDNLTCIMDRNNIQIDGMTEDIMPLESVKAKYEAFNWHVLEIDGHNMQQIIDACNTAKAIVEKPVMIIAHTIPGKGVDFMEFNYEWHGKPPNKDEAKAALHQLRTLKGKISGEHE